MKVSVIIPCYNEEEVVEEAYSRIEKAVVNYDYELIFINDGSKDKTGVLLNDLALSNPKVKILTFSRNFGHQAAVAAGINHCNGEVAIILDADLQDPPELIPEMIRIRTEKKCNVVYGVRKSRKGEGFFKKITAYLYYRILNMLSDVDMSLDTGDFRLIDIKVINAFNRLEEKNKYIRGLISWMGFHQEPLYYDRDSRKAGETKYPARAMIKFASTGLIYFSKKPLTIAINLGFLCILVGLGVAAYALYVRLSGQLFFIPGWASTMTLVIFFGGVQLLTVGIIGKYIGGIFDEVKQRPEYIISDRKNID